jgi:hypothetical protein
LNLKGFALKVGNGPSRSVLVSDQIVCYNADSLITAVKSLIVQAVLISSQSGKRQMSDDGTKGNFFEAEKIDEKIGCE